MTKYRDQFQQVLYLRVRHKDKEVARFSVLFLGKLLA